MVKHQLCWHCGQDLSQDGRMQRACMEGNTPWSFVVDHSLQNVTGVSGCHCFPSSPGSEMILRHYWKANAALHVVCMIHALPRWIKNPHTKNIPGKQEQHSSLWKKDDCKV